MLGLLFIGLGFYALASALLEWADGLAFSFHAVDTTLADVFGAFYIDGAGQVLRNMLADWPAFFVLVPLGALLAYWGTRPRKPKPKFRKI